MIDGEDYDRQIKAAIREALEEGSPVERLFAFLLVEIRRIGMGHPADCGCDED